MRPTIHDLLKGRDNNFNLIRFLAAVAVIYDHSYMVPNGEPVSWLPPYIMSSDFGWYAVNVFFILSGFLVTRSWMNLPNIISFAVSRCLRVFPALSVGAFMVAFVIGPIVCLCLYLDYLHDSRTWLYVPMTASLISPSEILPFVFETLPAKAVVNSPLWTLRYEALSYIILGGLGVAGLFATRRRALATMVVFFAAYLTITLLTGWRGQSVFLDSMLRFWLCFFLGASVSVLSDRLSLRASTAAFLFLAAAFAQGTAAYEFILQIALAYGVFWFALIPGGAIRRFNELGDYSYGLYIFAWPIQQTALLFAPNIAPHEMFVLVTPAILIAAAASWHLVERPALDSRGAVMGWVLRQQQRLPDRIFPTK